jgi:uncharacterized membrane protein
MTTPQKQPVTGWQRSLVIGMDKLIYRFSKHWLWVFNIAAFIYVGLPILAPILMNAGATGPARVIYTAYGPMCHQMASRSFFLFGQQAVYPRDLAGTEFTPIETYMPTIPEFEGVSTDAAAWADSTHGENFLIAARRFLGNEQLGYKMALCERDIGIYSFVFIGGLLYALLRRRIQIKPLSLIAFMILGMGPIGLDGFTQLFSMYGAAAHSSLLLSIFPLRESTPYLRTFTGIWFGLSLVWLSYPHIEASLKQTEHELEAKLKRIGVLS